MKDITALILTYNEKENIERTVRALHWLPLVVIVDSYSTDDTIVLARKAHPNVRVIGQTFDSHGQQWNFGLGQITTEWVLTLDADYEVPEPLRKEIEELSPPEEITGYSASFAFRIFGHDLRKSVYPPRVVLFRCEAGRYFDDGHTQQLKIRGKTSPLVVPIVHDDRKPLTRWLSSQDRYARLEATHLLAMGDSSRSLPDRLRLGVFWAAPAMFVYLLFGKGLVLDGWPGWFYVCQRVIAELILSICLLIEKKRLEGSNPVQ